LKNAKTVDKQTVDKPNAGAKRKTGISQKRWTNLPAGDGSDPGGPSGNITYFRRQNAIFPPIAASDAMRRQLTKAPAKPLAHDFSSAAQ
jgi:hypothetical protein